MQSRVLLYILFIFATSSVLSAQETPKVDLSKKFRKYDIISLPAAQFYNTLNVQRSEEKKITINNWDLSLFDSEIISPSYKARLATPEGIIEERAPQVLALNGYTRQGGRASLTFADNFIYGFVEEKDKTFYIEPLYHQTRKPSQNLFIVYATEDIIDDEIHTCATDSPAKLEDHEHAHGNKSESERQGLCYEVEYSIANDFLMFQAYGSSAGVQNHAIGVLNNVQTNYDDEFTDELQFIIVEQFVSTCATCDPWTNSTQAENLLNSFTNWAPGGFSSMHDIGSIWTDRDFNGSTIGIAWVGAICTPIQYNALQDFTSNANLKRVMVAHEFGHNFDANHDASGSPYIMAPAVQNTSSWSNVSKTDIQNFYNSLNCLDFCASVTAPTANFTYNITSECAPGVVQFTNQSVGTISSYQWSFQGGSPSTSTSQNPVVTYANPGVYSVTLTVSNGPFSNSLELIDEITILPVPDANFTFEVNGNVVTFTNTSEVGPNAVFTWDFDDGNTSNEENPVHTYVNDGSYSVILTIDDICGFDNRTKTVVIATPPVANFTASPTSGCGTFQAAFNNTSTPNATIYDWEFPGGNPSTSILKNPIVTYSTPGVYPVTLTASNAQGSNTKTIAGFINVSATPVSAFAFNQTGLTFNFTSQASNAGSHLWNFGDGNTSNQINPTHTYAAAGNYTVTLTISNGVCTPANSSQNVTASLAPVSSFTVSASTGCAPFTTTFNNTSANNPTVIQWQFQGGNPETSSLANPTVLYQNPGSYDVTLITINALGSDTLILNDYILVETVPSASFTPVSNEMTFNFNYTGNGALNFLWNFGDGNTSTEENPVHVYQNEGMYTVNLSASNACGSVNTSQNVEAYFIPSAVATTNSPTQICEGTTVTFMDESTGTITNRLWLFEGASPASSTESSPAVAYQNAGVYDVTLIVSNTAGSDTIVLADFIAVNSVPATSINPAVNGAGITLSNGGSNYNSFYWTLPDSTTSVQSVVEFTAPENGVYKFYLVNVNECGSSMDSFSFMVNVYPEAVITSTSNIACTADTLLFECMEIAGATYNWTFQEGYPGTAASRQVNVAYFNSGNFNVSLIVTNALGSDTLNTSIQIFSKPEAGFNSAVNTGGNVDFQFTGSNANSVSWDFAGLGSSADFNPSFTFPVSGTYTVKLVVFNECGTDTISKDVVVVISSLEENEFLNTLKLYPNPAQNIFYIETQKNQQITDLEIFNALGQRFKSQFVCDHNRCAVQTEDWTAGSYFIKVRSQNNSAMLRIQKM